MIKWLILLLSLSNILIANSQNLSEIDVYLKEKNILSNKEEYFNIFLSSKDCYRCISSNHQLLMYLEKENNNTPISINIITDEISFARKTFKEYNLKLNYVVDKKVFNRTDVNNKSFQYLKFKNKIYNDLPEIQKLLTANTNIAKTIAITDDLLIRTNIYPLEIPGNKIFLHDPGMETGLLINLDDLSKNEYIEANTESRKLYSLPFAIDTTSFKLVDYDNFQIAKKEFHLPEIKIHNINILNNLVICNFSASRLFEELHHVGKHGLISNNYIAIKTINSETDLKNILDLDTYSGYFNVEDFDYNNKKYRVGIGIYSQTTIIDNNIFKLKVDEVVNNETVYRGEATLKLNKDRTKLEIQEINDQVVNKKYINREISLDGRQFYVDKEITDENTNTGIIKFIPI